MDLAAAVVVRLAHTVEERSELVVVLRVHRVAAERRVVVVLAMACVCTIVYYGEYDE